MVHQLDAIIGTVLSSGHQLSGLEKYVETAAACQTSKNTAHDSARLSTATTVLLAGEVAALRRIRSRTVTWAWRTLAIGSLAIGSLTIGSLTIRILTIRSLLGRIGALARGIWAGRSWRTVLLLRLLVVVAHLRTGLIVGLLLAGRRRKRRRLLVRRSRRPSVRRLGLCEIVATVRRWLFLLARHGGGL